METERVLKVLFTIQGMKGSALGDEYCIYRTPVKLINEGQRRHSCVGGMYTGIQNDGDIAVLKHAA